MAIKSFRPVTAGQRQKIGVSYAELTVRKPEKSLSNILTKTSARGSTGKITVRHKGGRQKRLYREIDFRRDKTGIPGRVATIEYDPNRGAFIALINYRDGEKKYILAPQGMRVGEDIFSGDTAEIRPGNALPLSNIPLGTVIHNVEMDPGKGGKIARSAGNSAILMNKEGKYAQVKLPSGSIRLILQQCFATIGTLSNEDHKNIKLGKAGKSRHLGIRPHVRGVAMAPNAHPHGGGEGRSGTGMPPKTPWGKRAYGKTRNRNKKSSRLIVKGRK